MGGTPPYGYMKNPLNNYELLVDEEQAEIVRRIFDMPISGMGTQKIANILTEEKIPIPSVLKNLNRGNRTCLYGIWHSKTIRDILKNEDYIGNLTQCREEKVNCKIRKRVPKERWIVAKGGCPAIVDEDKFYLVQDMFLKNTNQNSKSQEYLLRKFIYCKECGHTISINKHKWKKQDEEIENKLNNIKRKENYTEDKYKDVITEFLSMKKPNRQLLSSLIDRIEIDKDLKITIFYRFKPLF